MTAPSQLSGLLDLPDDWTPAQVAAVVEVLNLLLDAVCSKYADALREVGREDLAISGASPRSDGDGDF
jgi:hypothetical protein